MDIVLSMKNLLLLLYVMGLISVSTANASPLNCEPEKSLSQSDLQARIIIVGEGHGSQEMPDYFLKIACRLIQENKPLLIGLEIPASEQLAINNYMQSDGDLGDRTDLLSGIFWHRGRKFGMASEALLSIIETSRKWKKSGISVLVFSYDQAEGSWPERLQKKESFWGGYREAIMGLNIDARARLYPNHTLLIFSGGIHARKNDGGANYYPSMAYQLAARYMIKTITFSYPEGETWHCGGATRETMKCGIQTERKSKFVVNPDFDITIPLEKITASPPAVDR